MMTPYQSFGVGLLPTEQMPIVESPTFSSTTLGIDPSLQKVLLVGGIALWFMVNSLTEKAASSYRSAKAERKKTRLSAAKRRYQEEKEAAERGGWF